MLRLSKGAGIGQPNEDRDVARLYDMLEAIDEFKRPAFAGGGSLTTISQDMVDGMKQVQRKANIEVDGYALPGGPTEHAINNIYLAKPRGAALYADPAAQVAKPVGDGFDNDFADVKRVRRVLGAAGYLAEHPADEPSGFFDKDVLEALTKYQNDRRLRANGRIHPGDETESALAGDVASLLQRHKDDFEAYYDRAAAAGDPNAAQVKARRASDTAERDDDDERRQVPRIADAGEIDNSEPAFRPARGEDGQEQNKYITSRAEIGPAEAAAFLRVADFDRDDVESRTVPSASRREAKRPESPAPEGPGDPESNFGSWAIKREALLPDGVDPPDEPLKPDVPGNVPAEWGADMGRPGQVQTDLGVSRKREVRWLLSRLYRVGAVDEEGRHRLGDTDFARYIAEAREHIKPEHFAVFELTARAVRAGVLDWHTAATRLAAYYAPRTTGEAIVDFILDFAPVAGQVTAVKDAIEAIQDLIDARAYGDAKAEELALGKAAQALAVFALPGAFAGVSKALGKQLHHLVPLYLGGKPGAGDATIELTWLLHNLVLHRKMRKYFEKVEPGMVAKKGYPGDVVQNLISRATIKQRLDEFYRTLEGHRSLGKVYEKWKKIFPEIDRHFKQ